MARYVIAGLFIGCPFPFFVVSFYEASTKRDADESACNIHFAFVFQSFRPAVCRVIVVERRTRVFVVCPRRVYSEKSVKTAGRLAVSIVYL